MHQISLQRNLIDSNISEQKSFLSQLITRMMIIKMNHLKHRNRAATNTRIGTIMRTVSWQYSWVSTQRCSHFPIESNVCIFSTLIIKFSLHQSNWCMMWSEKFFSLTCKRSLDSFGVFDLLHKAIVCGKSIECLKEFWMEFFSALRSEEFVANLKSKIFFPIYLWEKKLSSIFLPQFFSRSAKWLSAEFWSFSYCLKISKISPLKSKSFDCRIFFLPSLVQVQIFIGNFERRVK